MILSTARPSTVNNSRRDRAFTPDDTDAFATNPGTLDAFPDWFTDPQFSHIFKDLVKVSMPDRASTLPTIYRYVSPEAHPVRHRYDKAKGGNTYIYVFDSTPRGSELAHRLSLLHQTPQGPVDQVESLGTYCILGVSRELMLIVIQGLLRLHAGDWFMARDLYGSGSADGDVAQFYIPQS